MRFKLLTCEECDSDFVIGEDVFAERSDVFCPLCRKPAEEVTEEDGEDEEDE